MIIDIHNHPDWHGYDFDKFIANMDEFNIDVTWLLTWESPRSEYAFGKFVWVPPENEWGPIPFERCLAYKQKAPDRIVLAYAPDPRRPDAIDQMEAAMEIYGVKVYAELKLRMMYDDLDALRMFRFCGEKKVPILVHIDYEFDTGSKYPRPNYWYGGGIEAFERAVQKCPETVFIGHAPGFWAHISGDYDPTTGGIYPDGPVTPGGKVQSMVREYPNLYCDISAGSGVRALSRDLNLTKEFIDEFQDRIMYGRDYFDNKQQELLNSLDLSDEILKKVYCENALKLVPLD